MKERKHSGLGKIRNWHYDLFVGLGENPAGFSGPKLALTCDG